MTAPKLLRVLLLCALCLLQGPVSALDDESRLKAVILGRFASYIEWPRHDAHNAREGFVIAVLGNERFANDLEQVYKQQRIRGKPVRIQRAAHLGKLPECDMLFIDLPTFEERRLAIAHAAQEGILSISEAYGFAEQGGFIQINVVAQNIRIKINHAAASRSGFRISAPLLSVATVVRGEQP